MLPPCLRKVSYLETVGGDDGGDDECDGDGQGGGGDECDDSDSDGRAYMYIRWIVQTQFYQVSASTQAEQ